MEQERIYLNREAKILLVQIASAGFVTSEQISSLERLLKVRTLRIEYVDGKEELEQLQHLREELGIEDDDDSPIKAHDRLEGIKSYADIESEVPDVPEETEY